jgi:excisionase family DNA binding protein
MKPSISAQREPLLTVPEAAERCRLSVRQMWRHIQQERLRVVRLGRAVRVRPGDLDRFIDRNSQ